MRLNSDIIHISNTLLSKAHDNVGIVHTSKSAFSDGQTNIFLYLLTIPVRTQLPPVHTGNMNVKMLSTIHNYKTVKEICYKTKAIIILSFYGKLC